VPLLHTHTHTIPPPPRHAAAAKPNLNTEHEVCVKSEGKHVLL